jgi:RNA polymerase sigma factor (TIGR02999 family)
VTSEGEPKVRPPGEISQILLAARAGDQGAPDRLFALVYDELRELARRHVRFVSGGGHGASSIVHELYLRIARRGELAFNDGVHFFAVASRAMRQIILDQVRTRKRAKRGGGRAGEALDEAVLAVAAAPVGEAGAEDLLALDAALRRLEESEPDLAEIVEWHYFGGLTFAEIATARGVSERTVFRGWRAARAFLNDALDPRP